MFLIILVTIYLNCVTLATSTDAVIVFNMYRVYNTLNNRYYHQCKAYPIAVDDEPTSIRIYVNSSHDFTSGGCNLYEYSNIIELSKTEPNYNTFLFNEPLVLHYNMYRTMSCWFYTDQKVTTQCDALFHIRTKTPVAQIYLNSTLVAATPTSLDVEEYDAYVSYYFEDGETVVVDCDYNRQSDVMTIIYYNNTGGVLKTSFNSIHIKLTQECHSNYIDCYNERYMISAYNRQQYYADTSVTRLFFNVRSASYEKYNFASIYWIWISGGITMIAITIIVILYIINNIKKKRNKIQSSNINHKANSPNSGNSPMPHPSQGTEDNSVELIEPVYSDPVVNRININKKTKNESDSNYANVDNTNRNVVIEPALIYADIFTENSVKRIKQSDAANYARVIFSDTKTDDSNYANVGIPGPTYVNCHHYTGKVQVETAYCEVQVPPTAW